MKAFRDTHNTDTDQRVLLELSVPEATWLAALVGLINNSKLISSGGKNSDPAYNIRDVLEMVGIEVVDGKFGVIARKVYSGQGDVIASFDVDTIIVNETTGKAYTTYDT